MPTAPPPNRVLLVSGPAAGGIRRHLDTLAAGLRGEDIRVSLAAPERLDADPELVRFDLTLGDRPRPVGAIHDLRTLRRCAAQWEPQLVHAHGVKAGLLSLIAFPRARLPVVITFHNLWSGAGALHPVLRLLIPRAAAAVTVSEAVRDSLESGGIALPNAVVIPNGVDLSAFPVQEPPRAAAPFTAAFLGRLTDEKGVQVLLETAGMLRSERGLRFVIAGRGPLQAQVAAAARSGSARIEYLGHQEDVLPVYQSAAVVLVPSLSEGLGLSAIEAMACGRPVIASRVGGLPEVISHNETGLFVPPADPAALARAIMELMRDPSLCARMGAAGRARVQELFTVQRMLRQVLTTYRRTAGSQK